MITLLCVGKNKEKALCQLENEYVKRIQPFSKLQVIEVKDESNVHMERDKEAELIREKEGKRILEKIRPQDFVILLDLHGKMLDSISFSNQLESWFMKSSDLVFVIAGSLGPSNDLVKRANVRWKLSDLTFTHLMTRILVLEQIYRAFMIQNGRSYHK
ncbi:MAG: 23S rRNA (pseudouridine(1915)-N(3))-methyltransferase RlmH [Erysipelotrichaceae bacterium]|nr:MULTISPECIES: 23S rRNA (pseudouridine(1915)-N(3))-methyltransferase RlmH [Faecalicoccus]MBE6119773.1 23S rRNA (pseudouridine(1915)-N(3))-methyltransferase RlmH [Erysipelotrichaceae bacterium]MDB7989671.1 23S rRNA (pseudouridine(1915)-N(3))-methyltransferase RlmH [Faecalicoccus pleomorphus]MDB7994152.1 23S rRNA (pseudouridine(1915)-N(3))-methyltransferase RlmH [Faecalicoccus pleomorphus]MDY5233963.1 23S rRNA (pseudouridine(1915)-N(3))-methyltransferase RlmH [Faecalicoccus sp.]